MEFGLGVGSIVFGTIFIVELPDKTFIATLVLSTRFRPLLVWIGVALRLPLQTLVAVLVGGLLAQLPRTPVQVVRGADVPRRRHHALRGAGRPTRRRPRPRRSSSHKGAGEAIGLKARRHAASSCCSSPSGATCPSCSPRPWSCKYDEPLSVFVGAFAALATVSGLAALLGRALLARIRLSTDPPHRRDRLPLLAALTALQIAGVIGG